MRISSALALVGVLLVAAPGAPAAAGEPPQPGWDTLRVGASARSGAIDVIVGGRPGLAADVAELVGGRRRPLGRVVISGSEPTILRRAAIWRCTRRVRTFVASARLEDGRTISDRFPVRTPSCRGRLRLRAPDVARPGARVLVSVRDRWALGDLRPRLCVAAPGRAARCRLAALRRGVAVHERVVALTRRGRWRVSVRWRGQRLARTVHVGVRPPRRGRRPPRPRLLVTGDSMMQTLDTFLDDRLRDRWDVESEVLVGTGLTWGYVNWIDHARAQARRLRPAVTVMFIGASDSAPVRLGDGRTVPCCGEAWLAEYARRAQVVMRAYARGGRGRVLWLTLPAPRSARRRPFAAAVNTALRRAAAGQSRVTLVPVGEAITPGFRYRATMVVGRRRVRLRMQDGIHLSVAGASVAASVVVAALRAG